MKQLLVIIFLSVSFSCTGQDVEENIKSIMQKQQDCWNKGDLNCFMIGYWESDSLMFIGKEKVYYGYQNTLNRYINDYPDHEAMGQLTFKFDHMEPLGADAYYVIGSYHLKRSIGDLNGHFTLLWKKISGKWVIVSDHSS